MQTYLPVASQLFTIPLCTSFLTCHTQGTQEQGYETHKIMLSLTGHWHNLLEYLLKYLIFTIVTDSKSKISR